MYVPQYTEDNLRTLDFDLENRPLSYWYDGNCTAEITGIGARFVGDPASYCWLLGKDDPLEMLEGFRALYDMADMVTGHYIRRHDLPLVNAAMIEYGLPQLAPKMTQDTRLDLKKFKDLAKSQEALGAMLGLAWPKEHMTQEDWRVANGRGGTITREAQARTQRRVMGDVEQHIELRAALLERGLLRKPSVWSPA